MVNRNYVAAEHIKMINYVQLILICIILFNIIVSLCLVSVNRRRERKAREISIKKFNMK